MKARALFTVIAVVLTEICVSPARPARANPELYLPAGTPIQVRPTLAIAGLHGMSKGAQLTFAVKQDVVVDGWIAIPRGALVRGMITTSTAEGANMPDAQPSPTSSPGAMEGLLHTAMTALNNATFAFEWVQLPAGKVRLDDEPQSVETALMGIGAGAFSAASNVMGMLKNQPGGGSGGDMSVHAMLEAHIAHGVHVPGLAHYQPPAPADSGFIDH